MEQIWNCGCIKPDDKELLHDGIRSELKYSERALERAEKLVEEDQPGCMIVLNSEKIHMKNILDLKAKIEGMTLCKTD